MEKVQYRQLQGHKISTICFGTATFVAGKLLPKKDSASGMLTLKSAIKSGINLIHSNSNLKTQWAIRETIESTMSLNSVHHLIKIETPLDKNNVDLARFFKDKAKESLSNINIKHILGVVYEIDIKKTANKNLLADEKELGRNFKAVRSAFNRLRDEGLASLLIFMAHNELEMQNAISSKCFDSYAAYYNLTSVWPLKFFDVIMRESKSFIGIRPLQMGKLTDTNYYNNSEDYGIGDLVAKLKKENISVGHIHKFALRFALAHPAVTTVIVGMSQPSHLTELIAASQNPLSKHEFEKVVFLTNDSIRR